MLQGKGKKIAALTRSAGLEFWCHLVEHTLVEVFTLEVKDLLGQEFHLWKRCNNRSLESPSSLVDSNVKMSVRKI